MTVWSWKQAPERAGRHPQIARIFADVFRVSTPLLLLRNLRLVTQSCQGFAWREGRSRSGRGGDFTGALEAAENAVDLAPGNASNHVVRGNALQVLMRLEDVKNA